MRRLLRRRERSQAVALAAVGMIAMVGALSMVVDASLFFIIQRNMQTAADAGALAGVWNGSYCSVIDSVGVDPFDYGGCDATGDPVAVATQYATANLGIAVGLCGGPENQPHMPPPDVHTGIALVSPPLSVLTVSIQCEARHWFTGIFPDLPLTKHIAVSAAATIGWPATNPPHDVTNVAPSPLQPADHLAARLIGAPQ